MRNFIFYSDGASRNNGNKDQNKIVLGSYGFVFLNKHGKILMKEGKVYQDVTNNQMELLGFIEPIIHLINYYFKNSNNNHIHVVSDSQYLIKGILEWMPNWKNNNWKNSSGAKIKNIELWKMIDKIINLNFVDFSFEWVKGHSKKPEMSSNEFYNNLCDTIANEYLDHYKINNTLNSYYNETINNLNKILEESILND